MQYIKPENLIVHEEKLLTLEVLREHTLACQGDGTIRERIIKKIDAQVAELKASVFERLELDGSIRIRHPSIGVMHINHEVLDEPKQLFASHIKSLVAYTITISRADAVVSQNQLIRYEPYEVITKLHMAEAAFAGLTSSPGRDHFPATLGILRSSQHRPSDLC